MRDGLDAFRVPREVRRADGRLADALDAVAEIDTDELPDDLQGDVREAVFALLAAKGAAEVKRTEVSVE